MVRISRRRRSRPDSTPRLFDEYGDLYFALIAYSPKDRCVESKSLKLYLNRFRNEGHFCEALAVKIRDDIAEALGLEADDVTVSLKQKARGGITITATS